MQQDPFPGFLLKLFRSPAVMLLLPLIFLSSCRGCSGKKDAPSLAAFIRDSALCEIDSAAIVAFVNKYNIRDTIGSKLVSFYRARYYRSAWTNNRGVNEYAGNFLNLLSQRADAGKEQINRERLENLYGQMVASTDFSCQDTLLRDAELLLSASFFDYARRNWDGMSDDVSRQVGWFIVRKRMDYPQLLEDFLRNEAESGEPVYRQYGLLRQWLLKYASLEDENKWPELTEEEIAAITPGDTSETIRRLRKMLSLTGDLPENSSSPLYDASLSKGIAAFQLRHGLDTTGLADEKTIAALAVPLHERVQQIIINMERCRWVPSRVRGSYVVVNIPQFRMHVYENDELQWSCNVIVGKSNPINKTVIFNDSIEMVVFNPYWNIPQNILRKEILPEVKKSKKYLEEKNMEVVDRKGEVIETKEIDWDKYETSFPYIIRERPGPGNSLGKVKFLFPNPYDIYLHDTPARELFNKTERTFSHGCVRISEPRKFAAYLLRDHPDWPAEKITDAMNGGQEIYVKLRRKVPVFIAYFTAWVDRQGRLNFGRDIYGHDEAMRELLFVN